MRGRSAQATVPLRKASLTCTDIDLSVISTCGKGELLDPRVVADIGAHERASPPMALIVDTTDVSGGSGEFGSGSLE